MLRKVVVNDVKEVDAIRQREMDITKERIEKILSAGATVVLTTKGIDDLCLKYFVEAGAMAVRYARRHFFLFKTRFSLQVFFRNLLLLYLPSTLTRLTANHPLRRGEGDGGTLWVSFVFKIISNVLSGTARAPTIAVLNCLLHCCRGCGEA